MGKETKAQGIDEYVAAVERLLASIYVPQLVRHIQILHEAMKRAGTRAYLKVGTSGTGGMGLNIPYTHGEERPSRVLLSKAAMAGAHSLLLFLMARTPGAPAIKEIKPSAAITWKQIGYGPDQEARTRIPLYDCLPDQGVSLNGQPFDLVGHRAASAWTACWNRSSLTPARTATSRWPSSPSSPPPARWKQSRPRISPSMPYAS